jgi:hypothetical protein
VSAERNGRWGTALEVPGTAALNAGGKAQVGSVTCTRAGACVAVGTYTDKAGDTQWFTDRESGSRWDKAAPVPDPALTGATISTVWCAPWTCAAGGSFTDSTGTTQAWVMTQTHGRWHAALEVPGIATLNVPGGTASIYAMSCPSPGNCAAVGSYWFNANAPEEYFNTYGASAFVVSETNGKWGKAEEAPGIMSLNLGWDAWLTLLSCPSAGNCTAAGYFLPGPANLPDPSQDCDPEDFCVGGFSVTEHNGSWGMSHRRSVYWNLNALACLSDGDCVLAGDNGADISPFSEAGIVTETNGKWGKLVLPSGGSSVDAVSCSSAGDCAAGGPTAAGGAYLISEAQGRWGKPVAVAGIPAKGPGATVDAVACPAGIALCVGGGFYDGPDGGQRAFLVSQSR